MRLTWCIWLLMECKKNKKSNIYYWKGGQVWTEYKILKEDKR